MSVIHSDESLLLDTAVGAMALAEAMDFHYTKPREKDLPPTIRDALKEYRKRRDRVPADSQAYKNDLQDKIEQASR